MTTRATLAAATILILCMTALAPANDENSSIGKLVADFSLSDTHGNSHSLAAFEGKLVVLAFVGTECPLARNYAPRLRELAGEYGQRGVAFLGIDANQQDSLGEIDAFAREMELPFAIVKDNNNRVADLLGAQRTPEVFLIDRNRVVRYRGRIDDQYGFKTGAGYVKPRLTERSLADAIDDLLAGSDVRRPTTKVDGCLIGRVTKVEPRGDVTYTNQIARLMQKRCVECHRPGELAPFTLTSYEDALGWAEMIREVVGDGRMPPWFADPRHGQFANDPRLTDEEKQQLFAWIDNGCPQGDPRDLPEPRRFADGWKIGTPDQVFVMADKPYQVPAEGTIEYKYFKVDPNFTEDKWVQAAECRPGNRRVVHHIILMAVPKGSIGPFAGVGLSGYAPGTLPLVCPPGMAVRVPAGSKLVFELHYTSNGTPQEDLSTVGLRYVDKASVKQTRQDAFLGQMSFRIPPGDPNYEVRAKTQIRKEALLLDLTPHMHLRGKSFRFEAEYPDGGREVLLNVPNYDFNWQLTYTLASPKLLPKGTWLHGLAYFDNSAANAANPDPTKTVAFGEQTWDEMMFGFYTTLDPKQDLTAGAEQGASAASK